MTENELLIILSKNPNGIIINSETSQISNELINKGLVDRYLTMEKGKYILKLTDVGISYLSKKMTNSNKNKIIDNDYKQFLIETLTTNFKTDFNTIINEIEFLYYEQKAEKE